MEDLRTSISSSQLETVNSICMYLRVFMLSKITDSNGCDLSTGALDGTATPAPSPLLWPYQPNPTKAAWLVWSKAVRMTYAISPTSNTLRQPMDEWIPHPNRHAVKPDWIACPSSLTLYHHMGRR